MDWMNISITDHLADYVRARVNSGRYNNASEVVREALTRMEQEDERTVRTVAPTVEDIVTNLTAIQTEEIRKGVLEGIADIQEGRYTEYERRQGLAQLTARIKARGRTRFQKAPSR